MTIEKAITLVRKEYENAKKSSFVQKPLAWALYQVWKKADSEQPKEKSMNSVAKPSTPFSNGTSYEIFHESFCNRCKKHKTDKYGFCAFIADGGCPIENALEDARFGYDFPSDDIVQIIKNGKVKYWHVCKHFETDDARLMGLYKRLFEDGQEG